MNVRQQKRVITTTAAVLAGLAVALGVWGIGAPVSIGEVSSTLPGVRGANTQADADRDASGAAGYTLADLRRVSTQELRRPWIEEPKADPNAAAAVAVARPPFAVTLVGTTVEAGHSSALLKQADGKIVVCMEGKSFDDPSGVITVKRVRVDRVTVELRGKEHELELPKQR